MIMQQFTDLILIDHKAVACAHYLYFRMKALLRECRFTNKRDKRSYDSGTSGHRKRRAG